MTVYTIFEFVRFILYQISPKIKSKHVARGNATGYLLIVEDSSRNNQIAVEITNTVY
jgi:hypothetical protein